MKNSLAIIGNGYRANSLISVLKIDKINYYGLEPSKNMYENAKKYLLHKNLYHSNLENFRPNIKFDCVWFLWNVIGHVSDIDIFFIKLSKLLKKNGYIIFDYNNIFNIREYGLINFIKNKILSAFTQIFKFKITKLTHTTEVKFYTISFLKKTLQKCNFEIEKVYYVNYENGNIEDNSHNGQVMMICKYVPK